MVLSYLIALSISMCCWPAVGQQSSTMALDPEVAATLQRILHSEALHNIPSGRLLDRRHIARATYHGDTERMRAALWKAVHGQNVTITAIGGSITYGVGAGSSSNWVQHLNAWVQAAFPAGNVRVHNGAFPAVGSDYFGLCVKLHVPQDADIVIVETAINDPQSWNEFHTIESEARCGFERLVRKLLSYPNKPAVVLLNAYCFDDAFEKASRGKFWRNAEAAYLELALYYGLPSLSVKGAAYHHMVKGLPGFQLKDPRHRRRALLQDVALSQNISTMSPYFYAADGSHPGPSGHQVFAELCIGLLYHSLAGLTHRPITGGEAGFIQEPLPKPMLANTQENSDSSRDLCFTGPALEALKVAADGFDWVDESKGGHGPKVGYTGSRVGASITLKINTQLPAAAGVPHNHSSQVAVHLGHLKSYEHMGVGRVSCISDCTCGDTTFDGHHDLKNSQIFTHQLKVSQAAECLIKVTIAEESSSPGKEHKVRITSLMVFESADMERAGHVSSGMWLVENEYKAHIGT